MHKPEIIFENEEFIAINKPAGLLSIPDREGKDPSLKSWLKEKYGSIFTVHRLDRETSGVILVAKSAVVAGDALRFSIGSRSYIDRSALQWTPHYAYVSFTDNTPVTNYNGAPILEGFPVPDNSNFNTRIFAIPPFTPSKQDTVVLWPSVTGGGNGPYGLPSKAMIPFMPDVIFSSTAES